MRKICFGKKGRKDLIKRATMKAAAAILLTAVLIPGITGCSKNAEQQFELDAKMYMKGKYGDSVKVSSLNYYSAENVGPKTDLIGNTNIFTMPEFGTFSIEGDVDGEIICAKVDGKFSDNYEEKSVLENWFAVLSEELGITVDDAAVVTINSREKIGDYEVEKNIGTFWERTEVSYLNDTEAFVNDLYRYMDYGDMKLDAIVEEKPDSDSMNAVMERAEQYRQKYGLHSVTINVYIKGYEITREAKNAKYYLNESIHEMHDGYQYLFVTSRGGENSRPDEGIVHYIEVSDYRRVQYPSL